MKARDLMTPEPARVTPSDSLQRVSQLMAEHDCGCIPVVTAADQRELVGVVTDRDIAIRAVAEGRPASTPVGEIMTPNEQTGGLLHGGEVEAVFDPPDVLFVEGCTAQRDLIKIAAAHRIVTRVKAVVGFFNCENIDIGG